LKTNTNVNDCLDLMRKLIEYRQEKALHHQLMKAAECSMLGIDTLVILYHCAKVSAGNILEVGSYMGRATIAMGHGRPRFKCAKENHQHRARLPERPASALQ
jgi:predicted O-methyltransferase YrrM